MTIFSALELSAFRIHVANLFEPFEFANYGNVKTKKVHRILPILYSCQLSSFIHDDSKLVRSPLLGY